MPSQNRPLCVLHSSGGRVANSSHDVLLRLVCRPAEGPIPVLRRVAGVMDPFFIGGGNENLLCGNCDQLLAQHVDREQLPRLVHEGDLVLVKASRGIRLEVVAKALSAEPTGHGPARKAS